MTEEEVMYRRCQIPGCGYKELRGSRQGDFIDGKFVCPNHFHSAANGPPDDYTDQLAVAMSKHFRS